MPSGVGVSAELNRHHTISWASRIRHRVSIKLYHIIILFCETYVYFWKQATCFLHWPNWYELASFWKHSNSIFDILIHIFFHSGRSPKRYVRERDWTDHIHLRFEKRNDTCSSADFARIDSFQHAACARLRFLLRRASVSPERPSLWQS